LNPALVAAVQHHQAGQLAEADCLYAEVLAAEPNNAHALHLRGVLAHATGRHEEAVVLIGRALALGEQPDFHYNLGLALSALGRRREAADHWARAVAVNPNHAAARLNLGNVLRERGEFDAAIAQHEAALRVWSAPQVYNSLGLSLAGAGRHEEAMAHYNRAIATQPAFIEPYLNLAASLLAMGRIDDALRVTTHSFGVRELPESRALLVRLVAGRSVEADNAALRGLIVRALNEGWTAPTVLAPASVGLVLNGPTSALIRRAAQLWPKRPLATEILGEPAALGDPLLATLMRVTVVCNLELEKFLSACRSALLETVEAGTPYDAPIDFASALAQQCFINEYAYVTFCGEEMRAARLRTRLDAMLASDEAVPPLWVAIVAAYFPLSGLANADALLARDWPEPVAAVLNQQVREPRGEALLRESLPRLTPIEDDVSRAVQAQYEANPYPRWVRTAEPPRYRSVDAHLRETFPHAPFQASEAKVALDILIAGCGTGQHAVMTTRQYEGARTLAIDLSRTSLAYAAARTRALGLEIEYAQADIMRIGALGRTFDLIESNGVLHHMADPYAGWRVLLSLLRPGGFMRIGLYSEIARRSVVAARQYIAEKRYGSTLADIRRFRLDMMRRGDAMAHAIMWFNDFYSTSECRDLVFHAQEHRMMLPRIKAFLVEQNLRFIGLEVDRETVHRYRSRFPADTSMADLDQWHAFELDNPDTFAAMYRFWVQKEGSR
jgi:SAM-dependent methyltransferase/Flp pilus assembly protein TadD